MSGNNPFQHIRPSSRSRKRNLILGLGIALLLGMAAGRKARADLKDLYSPSGELVDIGGYRLHLHCLGTSSPGSPTVVMEAGFASIGLIWSEIQSEISKSMQVCVYDRAGLGWSDPSPRPRTAQVMVAELHTLLNEAGIPGPYVLVGNSLGGMIARLYAHRYPNEAAGLVLIDAAHEEQFQRLPGSNNPLGRPLFRLLPLLVETGLPALFPALVPVPAQMPGEHAQVFRALAVSDSKFARTALAEYLGLEDSHAQLRAAGIKSLGHLPLLVISHGSFSGLAVRLGLVSAEKQRQAEHIWLELQSEMASQSSQGRLVVAEGSGHNIEFERPDLVIDAIQEVTAAARLRILEGD